MPARSLRELSQAGYVTEDWHRWQQGQCGTYALALIRAYPGLRLGVSGITGNGSAADGWMPCHWYAHDDAYAYDSAGRHPLPYHGVHDDMDYHEQDTNPDDWDLQRKRVPHRARRPALHDLAQGRPGVLPHV
jgi:hypothetical protein